MKSLEYFPLSDTVTFISGMWMRWQSKVALHLLMHNIIQILLYLAGIYVQS